MKLCRTCATEKPEGDFPKRAASKDGLAAKCRDCTKAYFEGYYREHRGDVIARVIDYRNNNREIHRATRRKIHAHKYVTNVQYRLSRLLRSRLKHALAGNFKTGSAVKALGCSLEQLRTHLESLFAPGMSWENAGEWHIDHIRPLAAFNLQDPAQFATACHFTNLQPLWGPDNLAKGAR
jgi:hypothetical protein